MRTKSTIFACSLILLVCAFTIQRNTSSRAGHREVSASGPLQQSSVPDHVVYNSVFRKVVRLREKTTTVQTQNGFQGTKYFPLQKEAKLSEVQASALEAIAFACRQQITDRDNKANTIIKTFQSRFPGGRVPAGGSPPPPPELRRLWEERTAIILSARESLRAALGAEEFERFDNFVKVYYRANKSDVTIDPIRPKQKSK